MHYSSLDMEFLITYGLLFLQILGTCTPVVVAASGLPSSRSDYRTSTTDEDKHPHNVINQQKDPEDSTRTLFSLSQPFRLSRSSRSEPTELKKEIIPQIASEIDAHEISKATPLKRPSSFQSHVTPEKVSNDNPNIPRFPPTTPASAAPSSLSDQEPAKKPQSPGNAGLKDKDQREGILPPSLPKAEALKSSNRTTEGTVTLRGACNMTEQCFGEHTECRVGICKCAPGYLPRIDNGDMCGDASSHNVEVPQADPTMIGVVVGLAFMSITLCVVLQLFARAQFRENRTIFNTPNPRLMNASLLKGSKTLLRGNSAGGQRSRRGSQVSIASGAGGGGAGGGDEEGGGHGQKVINTNVEFGGGGGGVAHSSGGGRPGRAHNHRQMSTDKEICGTPTSGRPHAKGKNFRQDSIGSAALDASSL